MMNSVTAIQYLRNMYRSYEFWFFVFDQTSAPAIRRMKNRFYATAAADDFTLVFLPPLPATLGIAAARKKRLLGRDLRRHLQRYVHPQYLPNDWSRDVFVLTSDALTEEIAAQVVAMVLEVGDLDELAQLEAEIEAA